MLTLFSLLHILGNVNYFIDAGSSSTAIFLFYEEKRVQEGLLLLLKLRNIA
jgi:hypothetical protein